MFNKVIVLTTHNKHKLEEFREIMVPHGFTIYGENDLNLEKDEPKEDGSTYEENAYIKAKSLQKYVKYPVIADDSGLEIAALNNFPGLYSARFASTFKSYHEAQLELIRRLENQKNREARFVSVICLLDPNSQKPLFFRGVVSGYILEEPKGDYGFGYDPIFHSYEKDLDWGLAKKEEKDAISHRRKAIDQLILYFAI